MENWSKEKCADMLGPRLSQSGLRPEYSPLREGVKRFRISNILADAIGDGPAQARRRGNLELSGIVVVKCHNGWESLNYVAVSGVDLS